MRVTRSESHSIEDWLRAPMIWSASQPSPARDRACQARPVEPARGPPLGPLRLQARPVLWRRRRPASNGRDPHRHLADGPTQARRTPDESRLGAPPSVALGTTDEVRQHSIDDPPLLVNVLRGDMSVVGPRRPLVREAATYDERIARRLLVKSGITGLWQVEGRSDLP